MQIQILFTFNGSLFSRIAAVHLKYEHPLTSFLLLCRLYFLFKVLQVLAGEDLSNPQCFFLSVLALCQLLMPRADGAVSHPPDLIRAVTTRDQMKPLNWICFLDHRNTEY